jgi:NADH-quinone oxidoreductase subunit M
MPLLDVINPHVTDTMSNVGVTDDAPTISGSVSSQGGHP